MKSEIVAFVTTPMHLLVRSKGISFASLMFSQWIKEEIIAHFFVQCQKSKFVGTASQESATQMVLLALRLYSQPCLLRIKTEIQQKEKSWNWFLKKTCTTIGTIQISCFDVFVLHPQEDDQIMINVRKMSMMGGGIIEETFGNSAAAAFLVSLTTFLVLFWLVWNENYSWEKGLEQVYIIYMREWTWICS